MRERIPDESELPQTVLFLLRFRRFWHVGLYHTEGDRDNRHADDSKYDRLKIVAHDGYFAQIISAADTLVIHNTPPMTLNEINLL